MALIRGKNMKPELAVRRITHRMGFRYRLHDAKLPGNPDLVFRRRKKIVFVHGCFWHRHKNCKLARLPKSRQEFWVPKLEGNKIRDQKKQADLRRMGWKVLVIWECRLQNMEAVENEIRGFLQGGS